MLISFGSGLGFCLLELVYEGWFVLSVFMVKFIGRELDFRLKGLSKLFFVLGWWFRVCVCLRGFVGDEVDFGYRVGTL